MLYLLSLCSQLSSAPADVVAPPPVRQSAQLSRRARAAQPASTRQRKVEAKLAVPRSAGGAARREVGLEHHDDDASPLPQSSPSGASGAGHSLEEFPAHDAGGDCIDFPAGSDCEKGELPFRAAADDVNHESAVSGRCHGKQQQDKPQPGKELGKEPPIRPGKSGPATRPDRADIIHPAKDGHTTGLALHHAAIPVPPAKQPRGTELQNCHKDYSRGPLPAPAELEVKSAMDSGPQQHSWRPNYRAAVTLLPTEIRSEHQQTGAIRAGGLTAIFQGSGGSGAGGGVSPDGENYVIGSNDLNGLPSPTRPVGLQQMLLEQSQELDALHVGAFVHGAGQASEGPASMTQNCDASIPWNDECVKPTGPQQQQKGGKPSEVRHQASRQTQARKFTRGEEIQEAELRGARGQDLANYDDDDDAHDDGIMTDESYGASSEEDGVVAA